MWSPKTHRSTLTRHTDISHLLRVEALQGRLPFLQELLSLPLLHHDGLKLLRESMSSHVEAVLVLLLAVLARHLRLLLHLGDLTSHFSLQTAKRPHPPRT